MSESERNVAVRAKIIRKAIIKHDKCLLSEEIRVLFLSCFEVKGHKHECKEVLFFPKEIIRQEVLNEFVFFVPVIPLEDENNVHPRRATLPIFMLNLANEQKEELVYFSRRKKWGLMDSHFEKPRISLTYEQKTDLIEEGEVADDECF